VVVLASGRPYAVGELDAAAAVVQTFLPGEEGGPALAAILSGRRNFSGKLPVQMPRSPGLQPHTYLHAPLGGRQSALSNLDPSPAYPFGHGLSYTTFRLSRLRTDHPSLAVDGRLGITVTVTNTGRRAGTEVVQLYASDVLAQVTRPVRSLLAFAKVHLAAGAAATITFEVDAERFAFTGLDGRLVVEPGTVRLAAGTSSTDLPLSTDVELIGPLRFLARRSVHAVPHHLHPAS
jgi:beta-glucosidase